MTSCLVAALRPAVRKALLSAMLLLLLARLRLAMQGAALQ